MRGSGIHVLYVEDDADIAELTREMLEEHGFRVTTARNGEDALARLEDLQPDVIVTDMMMPVLDGFGLLSRYRQRPGPHAPVIVMSAFRGYLQSAIAEGAAAALEKPFDIDDLVDLVLAQAQASPTVQVAPPASEVPEPPPAALDPEEEQRLAAVLALALEQPLPPELDAFAHRVAAVFGTPTCLVSIVTGERQYWSAFCGLPPDLAQARGTPRSHSFCTHAVAARAALVVQDTHLNPFFRNNELVRTRGFRFYAGVPVFDRQGDAVGTLCLLDTKPHEFTHFDLELLSLLGERVSAQVDERERALRPGAPESAFPTAENVDPELGIFSRRLFTALLAVEEARSTEQRAPLALAVLTVPPGEVQAAVRALEAAFPTAHLGRLGEARLGLVTRQRADEVETRLPQALGPLLRHRAVWGGPEGIVRGASMLRTLERRLGEEGLIPRLAAREVPG